jgi:Domain of unknown function (DUF1848)
MASEQIVISASRRTDIPAFYMDWFMAGIGKGRFAVFNPYNGKQFFVPATVDRVHTIVFWSKNFGPFLEGGFGERLRAAGFHLFFNFTVNSPSNVLEPHLPSLGERLAQMAALCRRFGADAVNWRFDPICCYETPAGGSETNLGGFSAIADAAAASGVGRCITSFMDPYPKILRRTARIPGFRFIDPPVADKIDLLLKMEADLDLRQIGLKTCCETAVLDRLPATSRIRASACIPNDLLVDLYGGRVSLRRDRGQRVKSGCQCRVSSDIGSYRLHPCYHNCLFCYANPVPPTVS